ncbi:MAG: 50S ribosomal protein L6 [Candidatus Uhrbacteria bacterium GW2011_GWF2_39_13]|uniref:Large ribosomal subunit protein uL6 n=1 Tax=Candidatus Uhrbacteria bacterium GW2011_GWF2_39_13 TaxID=1618995 RepID=A0A0G0MTP2_9BACT|nr:MAG: 50S ribosomal protein L6 [Candidatus Uhrbacteria bacterium GW2011_GWF2_39_13]HAU66746.1 50S ribosomal protein L6 [Candidatus Uhrbacteria bacterium]
MSRVGKKPILIPQGVDVTIDKGPIVLVRGPKGTLKQQINTAVSINIIDGASGKEMQFSVLQEEDKNERSQWGTARALVANMIIGVTKGFSKKLEVNGVGYRVNLSGRILVFTVGFSHDVRVELPEGIEAKVEGNLIEISGADKYTVGALADNLRKIRKPEPYKGKGIKYAEETIRRKAGKAQKAGE